MSDNEIRSLIITDRESVRRLMLTDQESEVLHHFRNYTVFSSFQVSAVFCFQPNHTSMVMRQLFDKGYVTRRRVTSTSGGSEYQYSMTTLQESSECQACGCNTYESDYGCRNCDHHVEEISQKERLRPVIEDILSNLAAKNDVQ